LIAERRFGEIDGALHDHVAHERANGIGEHRIARSIASRMIRGLGADVAWRGQQAKVAGHPSNREETMKTRRTLHRSGVRVTLGVAPVLSLPFVAMQVSDEVVWSLADFVIAGALLATIRVALELAVSKAGNLAAAVGIAALLHDEGLPAVVPDPSSRRPWDRRKAAPAVAPG